MPLPNAQVAALSTGRRVPVGAFPDGVATDAAGRLWTAASFGDRVTRLEPVTGQQEVITLEPGSKPIAVLSTPDAVFVTLAGTDQLARINPETLEVERLAVGDQPAFLALGADSLWVVGDTGQIDRVDPVSFTVTASVDVPGAKGVAIAGNAAWVTASSTNELVKIDLASNQVLGRFPIGTGPDAIVADGSAVWVANRGEGTVARFDSIYQQVTNQVNIGTAPAGLAIDGDRLWVIDTEAGTLVLVDRTTATVTQTIDVGRRPLGLQPLGAVVWVGLAGDNVLAEVRVWVDAPTTPRAEIVSIETVGQRYIPTIATQNFAPAVGGDLHVHLYWNSAPAEAAGMPGTVQWLVWDQPERVDDVFFDVVNRPADANAICVVVTIGTHEIADVNGDGAPDYDTGNCMQLPDAPV